ncbi:MAG TPA: hypothetical protein VE131_00575 [Terriglobales bacterium]|nr:hypothetical protein [Terriglobales bacterium]
MSFRNSITIVASPRPRVGKTLLARLLTDFHLHEGRSVAAFDLNVGEGTLAQFLPDHVSPSRIDDFKGQMALFDRLIAADAIDKIVDLGRASFENFFTLMSEFGFAEEACKQGIAVVVMHLMTPDATSLEAYRNLGARFPQATLTPVHNEIFGAAQYWSKYAPKGSGTVVVRLSLLASNVRKYVERPPFSFADSALAAALNADINIELQHWLRQIYREFRELYLRIMLTDLKSSIRLS